MQVLKITINDKEYSASRFPMRVARDIIKVQEDALELAEAKMAGTKISEELKERPEIVAVDESIHEATKKLAQTVLSLEDSLFFRQMEIIANAFGNQFTIEDIENYMTIPEVGVMIQKLAAATNGVFEKN